MAKFAKLPSRLGIKDIHVFWWLINNVDSSKKKIESDKTGKHLEIGKVCDFSYRKKKIVLFFSKF